MCNGQRCGLLAQLVDVNTLPGIGTNFEGEDARGFENSRWRYNNAGARLDAWISVSTGDIVLLANVRNQFQFGNSYSAQHGSLTFADSLVPVAFGYPGATGDGSDDTLLNSIRSFFEKYPNDAPMQDIVETPALCAHSFLSHDILLFSLPRSRQPRMGWRLESVRLVRTSIPNLAWVPHRRRPYCDVCVPRVASCCAVIPGCTRDRRTRPSPAGARRVLVVCDGGCARVGRPISYSSASPDLYRVRSDRAAVGRSSLAYAARGVIVASTVSRETPRGRRCVLRCAGFR